MNRRGITLLEVLVVVAMIGLIVTGLTRAYEMSLGVDAALNRGREAAQTPRALEDRITTLLQQTYLSSDANDTSTYFIAGDVSSGPVQSGGMSQQAGAVPDSITFTTLGTKPSAAVMNTSDDFETANQDFGPRGGIKEVCVSMTPVGDAPVQNGLFVREQVPADGDPSQGGYQRVFSDQVESIQFEFYDGINWVQQWDTRTGQKRLPAAVRITYRLQGDNDDRVFVVRLPLSDVTPDNPLQETDQ